MTPRPALPAAIVLLLAAGCPGPGSEDAGAADSGTDAGTDAGTDGGSDGGSDGGTDGGTRRPWNANEVSMLFPLDGGELLPMRGQGYELLPEALFQRLGSLDAGLPRLIEAAGNRDVYPELRVVSARIDPCFDGPNDAGECERQVRLVAQVIDVTGDVSDAAIHLFYRLDEARFVDTLARLRALSRARPLTGPLRVHPNPSAELLAIVRDACTELTRFTFMATGRSKNWFFSILDRQSDGGFAQSVIAGVGDSDSFTDQGLRGFRMGIMPAVPWFPATLLTTAETRALDATAFAQGYDALARLSNPTLVRTADVSCAACHAAESTQAESLADRDAGLPPPTPSGYASPRLLPDAPAFRLGNLHAFSYFFDAPAISERAVNETAEVVRRLESDAFLDTLSPADRARLE